MSCLLSGQKDDKNTRSSHPIVQVSDIDKKKVIDRWVINKSDRNLTEFELSVLQKGLNFAVTLTRVPVVEFITSIESASNLIGSESDHSSRLRLDCIDILKHAKVPESNISKDERAALRDLRSDDSIIITPADKGRATVILNTTTYKEKANDLLSDKNTYSEIKKDPTNKYKTKLVDKLKNLRDEGVIDQLCYRQLYPTTAVVPKFYGLPKVHKAACPLRPIVASRQSITYDTAKYVANILVTGGKIGASSTKQP